MMERKFTDDEIVKALECCFIHSNCTNCPLQSPPTAGCLRVACTQALDRINRQKEEIERLEVELKAMRSAANSYKADNERLTINMNAARLGMIAEHERLQTAKTEAVKEFVDRLNKEAENVVIDREGDFVATNDKIYDTVSDWCKETSDNLLKEMTGENNGN